MNRRSVVLLIIGWFFIAHTAWTTPLGGGGRVFLASPDFAEKTDCEKGAEWVRQRGGDPSPCWHSTTSRDNTGGLPKEMTPSPR